MEYKLTPLEAQNIFYESDFICLEDQISEVADAASDKAYKAFVALIKHRRDEARKYIKNHNVVTAFNELLKEIGEAARPYTEEVK